MEGVRILAETAVYTYSDTFFVIGLLGIIFGLSFLMGFGIIWIEFKESWFGIGVLIGLIMLTCGVTCANRYVSSRTFSHMEYKVIVEDGVEFNEFLSYYEILEQDGEIYTVKERGNVDEQT